MPQCFGQHGASHTTSDGEGQMTGKENGGAAGAARIVGSLRTEGRTGVVRVRGALAAGVETVWAAITDPAHLARWHGKVDGDLRPGGSFHVYLESDDWEGTGHVDACDPPRHLAVTTRESEESWRKGRGAPPFDAVLEATLAAAAAAADDDDDDDGSVLVVEVRGLPVDLLDAYGAGWQIHVENLAAYVEGGAAGDVEVRWAELLPAYRALAGEAAELAEASE